MPAAASRRCLFAVRLVDIDVEYAKPVAELDATCSPLTHKPLRMVPIVRVFGTTPRGQKACLHVHGCFRYFLVPYDGERQDEASLRALALELEDQLRQLSVQPQAQGRQQPAASAEHAWKMIHNQEQRVSMLRAFIASQESALEVS